MQVFTRTRPENLAYGYRSAGRLSESLDIFLGLHKQSPDNYHLVEDCVETYLAMNDPAGAVRLLNSLQLDVIKSEESEAANQLNLWMETYPIMAKDINPVLIKWAEENKSNQPKSPCTDNEDILKRPDKGLDK